MAFTFQMAHIICQENGIVFQSGAANKKVIIFNKKPLLL